MLLPLCHTHAAIVLVSIALICFCNPATAATEHASGSSSSPSLVPHADHLVVLVHGLMGTENDLLYLNSKINELEGFVTLRSKSNWWIKSLSGVRRSAERLVEEIQMLQHKHPTVQKISFVGNSLGGVIARHAIQIMHHHAAISHQGTHLCASPTSIALLPVTFITVASPFLGVNDFTYIEDYLQRMAGSALALPRPLKKLVALTMWRTGEELFMQDHRDRTQQLLYKMSHSEEFLQPLRLFQRRRAYANLDNDFMVILQTGAFLSAAAVEQLRQEHIYSDTMQMGRSGKPSIVAKFTTAANQQKYDNGTYESMRQNLDNLGWEKFVVYFPGTLPLAHNAIAGVCKKPDFLFMPLCKLMGFTTGYFVMDHAALFLARSNAAANSAIAHVGESGGDEVQACADPQNC